MVRRWRSDREAIHRSAGADHQVTFTLIVEFACPPVRNPGAAIDPIATESSRTGGIAMIDSRAF
jgi:hypothetical protein